MTKSRTIIDVIDVIESRSLFASWFNNSSWDAWKTFLRVLFALPLSTDDLATYQKHTGRTTTPVEAFTEAWLVVGRRGGKSLIASLVAVFLACFYDYSQYLQPGEVGTIAIIAADRKQARTILRYIKGFLEMPLLRRLVVGATSDSIELSNHITIEIHTCSFRSVRGYTLLAVICDEIAFWRSEESANPDKEIISAVRPGLSTIPTSLLLCISSPYARRGTLWDTYSKHFGKDSDVLVWQAASREMNPSLRQSVVDKALEEDEASALAEYGAEFRRDIESYIDSQLVRSLVIADRHELPFVRGIRYAAFTDPAGGSGQDSYTLCIGHSERNALVIDLVREQRPPFSPEQTTAEFASVLKEYGVKKIYGDKYAGEWPREQFAKRGITYQTSPLTKSELYKEALPLFNSRRVELLDHKRLVSQLCGLERRTGRSGNDSIDHAPNQHDDLINAACGTLAILRSAKPRFSPAYLAYLQERQEGAWWERRGVNEHRWRTRE